MGQNHYSTIIEYLEVNSAVTFRNVPDPGGSGRHFSSCNIWDGCVNLPVFFLRPLFLEIYFQKTPHNVEFLQQWNEYFRGKVILPRLAKIFEALGEKGGLGCNLEWNESEEARKVMKYIKTVGVNMTSKWNEINIKLIAISRIFFKNLLNEIQEEEDKP